MAVQAGRVIATLVAVQATNAATHVGATAKWIARIVITQAQELATLAQVPDSGRNT